MNLIRRIRRAAVLVGLGAAALAITASAASASAMMVAPHPDGGVLLGTPPPEVVTVTHTVVAGGMPGWQITLIALGAALLAAAAAVLADRARAARKAITTTA